MTIDTAEPRASIRIRKFTECTGALICTGVGISTELMVVV